MISALIPVLNGGQFLVECYESMKAQAHLSELIFIDNGSTDHSLKILNNIKNMDDRVLVLSCPEKGISNALNLGLKSARNEIVARIDCDDLMLKDRCLIQFEAIVNKNVDLVSSQLTLIDINGGVLRNTLQNNANLLTQFSYRNPVFHPSVMYKKDHVLGVGAYRSKYDGAEDLDLWLRMLKNSRIEVLNETLTKYRIHDGQVTSKGKSFYAEFRVRRDFICRSLPLAWKTKSYIFPVLNLVRAIYCLFVSTPLGFRIHSNMKCGDR